MSLQLPLIRKQNQSPPVPPTVTVNSEGGVEEEDRLKNSRNQERMLLILLGRGKKHGKERRRRRRRNKQKKNCLKVFRRNVLLVISLLSPEQCCFSSFKIGQNCLETFCLRMMYYSVMTQANSEKEILSEQYFPVVLFIMLYKVALTFESVDKILKSDHSNESY